jgi:hypothetical protein
MLDGRSPGSRGIPKPLPSRTSWSVDVSATLVSLCSREAQHPEGGILGQSLGVVGVLVAPQTAIDGLTE